MMTTYRVYADETVVHEDDFEERDNTSPYYDDYSVHTVPEGDKDAEYWGIPEVLRKYIISKSEYPHPSPQQP